MPLTPILGIQQVTPTQSQKEVTINDALLALESATNATFLIDVPAAAAVATVGEVSFMRAYVFKAINATVDFTVKLPRTANGRPISRVFFFMNASDRPVTVTIADAAGGTTGQAGLRIEQKSGRCLYMLGDDLGVASAAATTSRLIDLVDSPATYAGAKGKALTVNQTEDGFTFQLPPTPALDGLSDVEATVPADGQFLRYNAASKTWVAANLPAVQTNPSFLSLNDTPDSYTGQAAKIVAVNATGDGLTFVDPATGGIGGADLPAGGTTGQILTKTSDADGDADWADAPAGGSVPVGVAGVDRGIWQANPALITFESGTYPADWTIPGKGAGTIIVDSADSDGQTSKALRLFTRGATNGTVSFKPPVGRASNSAVTIRYRTSSEPGYDFFRISFDGVDQFSDSGSDGLWKSKTLTVPDDVTLVELRYTKDASGDSGEDTVFISSVRWGGTAAIAYKHGDTVTYAGRKWIATVAAPDAAPSFGTSQWSAFLDKAVPVFVAMTQAEYDALAVKDPTTLYLIAA